MPHVSISQILLAYTAATCAFAWWKGGRAERLGALLVCADWLFIWLAQTLLNSHQMTLRAVAVPALAADFFMCLGFLWLCFRFGDTWLGAALVVQGAQFAVYGSYIAGDGAHAYAHVLLANAASFVLLDILIVATAIAWWRRTRARRRAEIPATVSA